MTLSPKDCCVLNAGNGGWAFEPLAKLLAAFLGVDVSETPRRFNYLLYTENSRDIERSNFFIPIESIRLASDKRLLANAFQQQNVPTPETKLIETFDEVLHFLRQNPTREWCLKYPTSCGANGHRFVSPTDAEPPNWPRPFVVQEFIRMPAPEVYRTYCAGGELFGWVARRFPEGSRPSPWVAHARGARYVKLNQPPAPALAAAEGALRATGLWENFGCVDLLCGPNGKWLVLEVGTDGLFNHVDRDLGDPDFEAEMLKRITASFWRAADRSTN